MLRYLYTLLHYIALPGILIRLLWRSRITRSYRQRWLERFGYIRRVMKTDASIWVHAVSVGEAIAAIPLIRELVALYPQHTIVVTTTTPTGSLQITKAFSNNEVMHVYTPYDVPSMVYRFLRRSRTELCIIMETELWPNLLHCCRKLKVPVMLANARLSELSKHRYHIIPGLTKRMLKTYDVVAAQGVLDGERLLELGLDPKKLMISGNIKFDLVLPNSLIEEGKALRKVWGKRPVFIAASTHDGEEEILLDAYKRILEDVPETLMVLVPRHPERFAKVDSLCKQRGYRVARRSLNQQPTPDTHILLGDTMGELRMIYAACDIAFVGGSLVPTGGHNLIEPAALGLPVLTGPHLHNFTDISKLLQHAGGAQVVSDAKALAQAVVALFSADELCEKMGARAREVVAANGGALQKHLDWIQKRYPPTPIKPKLKKTKHPNFHVV